MQTPFTTDALKAEISRRAYLRFCERGQAPGQELDDWLAAERDVLSDASGEAPPPDSSPVTRREKRRTR
jgi:hypothetical protein